LFKGESSPTHPFPGWPVVSTHLESDPTGETREPPPRPSRSPTPASAPGRQLCSTNSSVAVLARSRGHAPGPSLPPKTTTGTKCKGTRRPAAVTRAPAPPSSQRVRVQSPRRGDDPEHEQPWSTRRPRPYYPGRLNESSPFATLRGTGTLAPHLTGPAGPRGQPATRAPPPPPACLPASARAPRLTL